MSIPITTTAARSMRRTLINLAKKKVRVGSGSASSFLRRRTFTLRFPVVTPILDPIPWAAVGAAATRLYMPERMTNNLDILIRQSDAMEARTKLKRSGANLQGELSIGCNSWLLAHGFPLDVIESDEQ